MRSGIVAALTLASAVVVYGPFLVAQSASQAGGPVYMPGINYDLPAVLVTTADLARTRKTMEEQKQTDVPIRMVDCGGDEGGHQVGVSVVRRNKGQTGPPAAHDQVSEVYHILEGTGTVVVGGKITNPKRRPFSEWNGPGLTGDGVTGGVPTKLTRGDVFIIPAGTPHWFTSIDESMFYTVVRVDPSKVAPLK
jgi:mannose-6-phosphate isomerase-like protein (cupin superfamily)